MRPDGMVSASSGGTAVTRRSSSNRGTYQLGYQFLGTGRDMAATGQAASQPAASQPVVDQEVADSCWPVAAVARTPEASVQALRIPLRRSSSPQIGCPEKRGNSAGLTHFWERSARPPELPGRAERLPDEHPPTAPEFACDAAPKSPEPRRLTVARSPSVGPGPGVPSGLAVPSTRPLPGSRRPGPRRHIAGPVAMCLQEFSVRSSGIASAVSRQVQLAPASSALRRGSEYAELSRQVKEAGLLERRSGYYTWKIAVTIGMLAAGWTAFVLLGNSWWQLAVAVFLAVIFTQIGFLGHDAGHRQVFGTRRANFVTGILLGNLGIGLSYGWWVDKHNRHHAHPNTEDSDPDISVGAFAFTAGQARASRGLARLMFRYQAYLFFPLLLLEGLNLHVASVQALTRRASRHRSGSGR